MNYRDTFLKIADDIRSHPDLELVDCCIGDELGQGGIEAKKEELWGAVPYFKTIRMDAIFDFYRECNGVHISWRLSPDVQSERLPDFIARFPILAISRNETLGCIRILPFDDVFIIMHRYFDTSDQGEHFTQFCDYTYEGDSFGKILFLFDLYSDTCAMSFVPDEDEHAPKVILVQDYYIVWDSSRVTFFESYVNFLAASRGLILSRETVFGEFRGDKLEPIEFASPPYGTSVEPSLFRE